MIKEDFLKVQTCVLKVSMHCPGCEKQVKKIIQKIDGVFQSTVDKAQGKVTVSGLMDPYTVIKKLNKAHKRAQLWGPNPEVAGEVQKLQLGNGGKKGQPKGGVAAASGSGGGGDGAKGEEMVVPPPPPKQHPQQLQKEMEMKGVKLPPQLMGMGGKMPMPAAAPPAKAKAVKFDVPEGEEPGDDDSDSNDEFDDDKDFEDDGLDDDDDDKMMMMKKPMAMPPAAGGGDKKGGNGGRVNKIPVQNKGNDNIDDMIADLIRAKQQNQGGAGGSGKNGGGAQAPQNGKGSAPGGGNKLPGKANKKGVAAGGPPAGMVGGPMIGGMPHQPGMTMRPPNMMGGAGFPGMGQTGGRPMGGMTMGHPQNVGVGMQPAGGGSAAVHGMTAGGRPPMGGMPMGHPQNGGIGMQTAAGGGSAAMHGMTAGGTMPGAGLYPGGAGVSVGGGMAPAPEMMQAAWNNPVAQQQPYMMMNGDGYHVHGGDGYHVHGGAGYPPMGYGYGYGYGRPPMYHHPPPHPNDNMFSDENPNSCSVM